MFKTKFIFTCSVFCYLLFACTFTNAQNINPTITPNVSSDSRALIEEVRLLRFTLLRALLSTNRSQYLSDEIAHLRIRVEGMQQELDQCRATMQQLNGVNPSDDDLRELEAEINRTSDAQVRGQLQQTYENLKRGHERQREYSRQEAQRTLERQQLLAANLHTEQSRLAELQRQREAIELELNKQIADLSRSR